MSAISTPAASAITQGTLAALFDPGRNSLNGIRLFLAACVIVSHSWVIGNIGAEPEAGGKHLGEWAVLGFFAVSGYLITRSRLNGQPASSFFLARFLRIYPGFIVCLLMVAFVFAPLSLLVGSPGSFTLVDSLTYVARNFLLYPPVVNQLNIGTTVPNTPVPGIWNGALWTLFWEAACYVGVGILGCFGSRRLRVGFSAGAFGVATVTSLAVAEGYVPTNVLTMTSPLIAAFSAGALVYFFSNSIHIVPAVVVSVGVLVIALFTGTASVLAPMPAALVIMTLGSVLPFTRLGAKTDLSYGVYIYGVPVQNILEIGWPDLPVIAFILLSLLLTLPLAWASFRLIEAPAMRLRSKFYRRLPSRTSVPISS
ncbi:acyltransferase [Pseudarthrobacter sp. NamE2]|uniref:acyltransferase family protein n=1 Tax=Pseudarthrobacter sp. NamE2 TaxID=2576838 RepID=UPI0014857D0D|nr:acyltransferase [Pseudarthrobacter sp. NamE2]